jgi:hypothetical protein
VKAWRDYPEAVGVLIAAFIAICLTWSLWVPVSVAFRESQAREKQRLTECFSSRIAAAMDIDDDVARLDELRRLEKIPDVLSAHIVSQGSVFQALQLDLSDKPLRVWRARYGERAWSAIFITACIGGLAGFGVRRYRLWLIDRLRRHRVRCRIIRQQYRERLQFHWEDQTRRWLHQALRFVPHGIVLLDGNQRIIAFNPPARHMSFNIDHGIGRHWLELESAPEWAAALRETLEHPGLRVIGPVSERAGPSSLLTFMRSDQTVDTTWLMTHDSHV